METILVVDDDNINLAICKAYLSNQYNVITTQSGVQALGYIRTSKTPDLILLDIYMPSVGGFEVLQQIRQMEKSHTVPVIMVTASDDIDILEKGYSAGASDFLFKPINQTLLHQKVKTWLDYRRLQKENDQLHSCLNTIKELISGVK